MARRRRHLARRAVHDRHHHTALRRGNEALDIEDVALDKASPIAGRTLDDLDHRKTTGATLLAILRDGRPVVNLAGDLALKAGDQLLALGTGEQLARLEQLVASGHAD